MKDDKVKKEIFNSKIWREVAAVDNPFVAEKCFCSGYDVYSDLLSKASWFEYLYLMFKLEKPEGWKVDLLEKISIAVANPGIRDLSVRAAMSAGVGGSTSASVLMAALAVGAGQYSGAREVFAMVKSLECCQQDLAKWSEVVGDLKKDEVDGWPQMEHPPGFDPNGTSCAEPVKQVLSLCAQYEQAKSVRWIHGNRLELERMANMPLAMSCCASAALHDIGFDAEQSEIIYLMMRLPGAAAHALEQKAQGWKNYPFYLDKYVFD